MVILQHPVKTVFMEMMQVGVMEIVNGATISVWQQQLLELQEVNTGIIVFNDLSITKCNTC